MIKHYMVAVRGERYFYPAIEPKCFQWNGMKFFTHVLRDFGTGFSCPGEYGVCEASTGAFITMGDYFSRAEAKRSALAKLEEEGIERVKQRIEARREEIRRLTVA